MRLPGYNYSQAGTYFVTLCTYRKSTIFGFILNGETMLSDLGMIVREEWRHISKFRPNVQLDQFVVMPNHLHGLVIIEDDYDFASSRTLQAGSLGAIIGQYKIAVTRRAKSSRINYGQNIWQRNYHEHIVRNDKTLNDIRRYIIENPARWQDDSLYVA